MDRCGEIRIGMTRADVYSVLGKPANISVDGFKEASTEAWSDTPTKGQSLLVDFGIDSRVYIIKLQRSDSHPAP